MTCIQTTKPRRIHVTRKSKTPKGAIYAGRGSCWEELLKTKHPEHPAHEANLFKQAMMRPTERQTRTSIRNILAGRDLACTTPEGIHCFASVILEIANSPE